MKYIKTDELVVNQLYAFERESDGLWLFRFCRMDGNQLIINNYGYRWQNGIPSFNICKADTWGNSCLDIIREATYEETTWFEACEKAGRGVERPKLEQYEIY